MCYTALSMSAYWHCHITMRSRVYASVGRPSVCPIRPLQQHAAGLLLWAQPAGDVDQLLHGAQQCSVWRVNSGSATLSAYVGSITCFDAYLGAICCKLAHMLSCYVIIHTAQKQQNILSLGMTAAL